MAWGSWGGGVSSGQSPSLCVWKKTGPVGRGQHSHSGYRPTVAEHHEASTQLACPHRGTTKLG